MKEYKLHNTDGKTFFDFRSDPESRCEGFTISYLDDGTVVMSGDYGTLCWKREYNGRKDYGFPNEETNIGYFEEKVCQWGVKQEIREFNKDFFMKNLKKYYGDHSKWKEFEEDCRYLEEYDEVCMRKKASELFPDAWETESRQYTEQFIFMFNILKSVSDKIWDAVIEKRIPSEAKYGS